MSAYADRKLLLIGCGKMGGALLTGWLDSRILPPENIAIIDPMAESIWKGTGVSFLSPEDIDNFAPDMVMLGVKPQVLADVLTAYRFSPDTTVLSIAAGKTLSFLTEHVAGTDRVIRAMPNTPAAAGEGMTVLCPADTVSQEMTEFAAALCEAVGKSAILKDESLMDVLTAISGSGPAYLFLLSEVLTAYGTANGLPADMADLLARQTIFGSGKLLTESTEAASTLRENVTSKGGSTAKALEVLMAEDGLTSLFDKALSAAVQRNKELAG